MEIKFQKRHQPLVQPLHTDTGAFTVYIATHTMLLQRFCKPTLSAPCSCVYITPCLTTPLVRLITTFACVTLPECADFCTGAEHSYPNLLLIE